MPIKPAFVTGTPKYCQVNLINNGSGRRGSKGGDTVQGADRVMLLRARSSVRDECDKSTRMPPVRPFAAALSRRFSACSTKAHHIHVRIKKAQFLRFQRIDPCTSCCKFCRRASGDSLGGRQVLCTTCSKRDAQTVFKESMSCHTVQDAAPFWRPYASAVGSRARSTSARAGSRPPRSQSRLVHLAQAAAVV